MTAGRGADRAANGPAAWADTDLLALGGHRLRADVAGRGGCGLDEDNPGKDPDAACPQHGQQRAEPGQAKNAPASGTAASRESGQPYLQRFQPLHKTRPKIYFKSLPINPELHGEVAP
jgi:hypothetical protein